MSHKISADEDLKNDKMIHGGDTCEDTLVGENDVHRSY